MLNRLAKKPSTASLTPATTKIANAISIWLAAIAQTMNGTSRMRPSVMMFGMLNATFPGSRPDFNQDQRFRGPGPVVVYIDHAGRASHCTTLDSDVTTRRLSGIRHDRTEKGADLRGLRRRYRRRQPAGPPDQADGPRYR